MSSSFSQILPDLGAQGLPGVTVLAAAVLALAGLVLWGAGIKVARPMTAGLFGLILAAVGLAMLPGATGVGEWAGAGIGLVAGLVIGALAFRFLQAVALALCLGIAVAGGYYQSEKQSHSEKMSVTAQMASVQPSMKSLTAPLAASMALDTHAARKIADQAAQTAAARWQEIPSVLRWRMILAGAAAALASLIAAWLMPKHITWVMTAILGASLVIVGCHVLFNTYAPSAGALLPAGLAERLECAGVLVLGGMLLQRLFFWPGKSLKAAAAVV